MKSLLVKVPVTEDYEQMTPEWQMAVKAVKGQWSFAGRDYNGYRILDALVNDNFIMPGEVDEAGNPLTPTPLPPGWDILMAWKRVRQDNTPVYVDGTPVTVDAQDITDTTVIKRRYYSSLYVKPMVTLDTSDPENPVSTITGVQLTDRLGNVQTTLTGELPDSSGGYLHEWTEGGYKDVPGVGVMPAKDLNPDGSYTHVPQVLSETLPAWQTLMNVNPELIEYYPDDVTYDADGNVVSSTRPTALTEIHHWLGHPARILEPYPII